MALEGLMRRIGDSAMHAATLRQGSKTLKNAAEAKQKLLTKQKLSL